MQKTNFKQAPEYKVARHQKPLPGNPGLSLEEIKERHAQEKSALLPKAKS